MAREILAGKNWRNLPMLGALSLFLFGNALVHLNALGLADAAQFGNRLGFVTLLMLIPLARRDQIEFALWLAGAAWSAFGLFAVFYGGALARPRVRDELATPI